MRSASGPSHYATNEVPPPSGFGTFSMAVAPPEIREPASRTAAEHLDWLGDVMRKSGDATGALLAALMVRHLVPGEDPDRRLGFSPSWLYGRLGHIARKAFPGSPPAAPSPVLSTLFWPSLRSGSKTVRRAP
jgi:hypothetical protein